LRNLDKRKKPMNATTASHLSLDSMSEAFRESFDIPEASIELEYIRASRVRQAELHPGRVPSLRDRVRFAVVASDTDGLQVWRDDTCSGLTCLGGGLGLMDAKTLMTSAAEEWPERTDIMDESQLREYIFENHSHSYLFHESIDVLINALRLPDSDRDAYYSCSMFGIRQTGSGWAVWSTDDLDGVVSLLGLFETEGLAKDALATACERDALEYHKWLLEQAEMELEAAGRESNAALMEEYESAVESLREAIHRVENPAF
jgi:hypothetical protein